MRTKRLFYENEYQKEFEAQVMACGQDEKGNYVILNQTLFYPEGGGQPSDIGFLGENKVLDVQETDGEIRHYMDGLPETNLVLHGQIDWNRRFDLMQQHSGEHIVSGMIHKKYGYDNVGFHMGEEVITIDFNGMLDKEQVEEIEQKANEYIWKNKKAKVFLLSEEEKDSISYRSKKELTEEIRLMEFPGADLCACCGLHVKQTGEIGLVKLISSKKFKEGVRIEMLSGKRAFQYLNEHFRENSKIAVDLSVKPGETQEAVKRIQEEVYDLKGALIQIRKEKFEMIAKQCAKKGDLLIFEENMEPSEIQKCTDAILDTCGGICALLSGNDRSGYKYAVGKREGSIRELVKEMNQTLEGKGGGKPCFAQGFLKGCKKEIRSFFANQGFKILE